MLAIKSPNGYFQEPGLRTQTGSYLKAFSSEVRIISSPAAWKAVNPELSHSLEEQGIRWQLEYLNGECTQQAIDTLQQNLLAQGAGVLLGIGGGRVMDAAKAAGAAVPEVKVVNMPTLAATCAAWSPVSIIYNDQGGHLRSQLLPAMPELVLVDSEVIARSDVRYLKAGMVDALAKLFEFRPYQLNNPDNLSLQLKILPAQQALEIFKQYGDQAIVDNQAGVVTPALIKVIEANIVYAGLSNSVRDTLATPGFAHAIHNRLTHQPELHHWLHGEKVGFCLLIQSLIENNGQADAELVELLQRYSAPLKLPAFAEDRKAVIRTLAGAVRFPERSAAMLPFEISPASLEKAFLLADTLF